MSKASPAFSLVEVVLALGVAAVAFTSIMALFPVGLDMSRETHEETQAALIAQSILNDLRDDYAATSNPAVFSSTNRRLLATNAIDLSRGVNIPIGGTNTNTVLYLGYTNHMITAAANPGEAGTGGQVLRPAFFTRVATTNLGQAPDWYQTGSNGLVAVARVQVATTFLLTDPNQRQINLADILVETPGMVRSTNRTQFGFKGAFR